MTNTYRTDPAAARPGAALALGLGVYLAASLPAPAGAATLATHRHHTTAAPATAHDFAGLRKLMADWTAKLQASRSGRFLHGLTLTNPDGTLNRQAVARLTGHSQAAATAAPTTHPLLNTAASHHALVHAPVTAIPVPATVSSSSAPKSSAYMVLIPPKTPASAARPPVVASEVMTVPEPSAVVTTLALFGLAGGWLRRRRAATPSAP